MTAPEVWAQHEANHSIDGARRAHDKAVAADAAAYEARLPAREADTARVAATSPDPARQARRGLLFYLATGCPYPLGMPNHLDIRDIDLAVILHGLVDEPFEAKWDHIEAAAGVLKAVLNEGGVGTTSEAYAEGLLLDAIRSAAPDRGAGA